MREPVIGSCAFTTIVLVVTVLMWRGHPGQPVQAGVDRSIETSSIGPRARTSPLRLDDARAETASGEPATTPQD